MGRDEWGGGKVAGFKGNFQHNMDASGRVALPAMFRKSLERDQVMTLVKGMSEALYLIPEDRFDEWVDGCGFFGESGYKLNNDDHEDIYDRLYGDSYDTTIDSAGRINIPVEFREAAGLKKDVTFVGKRDRIEIWDTAAWEAHKNGVPTLKDLLPKQR